MSLSKIKNMLMQQKDEQYAKFQRKLLPNISPEKIIGVKTVQLKCLAEEIEKDLSYEKFLCDLPHHYFEENQLHGFVISRIKNFDECIRQLNRFLPYIDNWATCDQTSPQIFKRNYKKLLPHINSWLNSNQVYTIRFAIGMLMKHFLDCDFDPAYLETITKINSDEYYVNMEIAWYMATALAKQWDKTILYLENKKMDKWVHNKTIQKAIESKRISPEQKSYLKTLRQK